MKLKITIDDKIYEVDVEASEPEPAPLPLIGALLHTAAVHVPGATAARPAADEEAADEDKVCRSPLNGVVVRIAAQVGQSIQPGDILLVLEAMKMETNITAPCTGKIAKIRVAQGGPVTAGQIVIDFE
ncbi:MAG: acetyl-CoA carboxylase biotin carboxyl carrier protein subunit [Bryobacterales bacterium]|nr:acetyl-CoA carboxylase biotin carboxyl carrier protein subunit [Bryobacterales bacterium]